MTGSEIKRQVMEALPTHKGHAAYYPTARAAAALAPCVVLTPEEREKAEAILRGATLTEYDKASGGWQVASITNDELMDLLALLTPDPEIFAPRDPHTYVTHEPPSSGAETAPSGPKPAPDDIGPPAPGEGDDLPNPEIGMEC